MAIPKVFDVEFINYAADGIEVGFEVEITEEFTQRPQFKSFLVGTIALPDGTKKLLSLNKTSYFLIRPIYGKDTADWVGKMLVYDGVQECGKAKMKGNIWKAKE